MHTNPVNTFWLITEWKMSNIEKVLQFLWNLKQFFKVPNYFNELSVPTEQPLVVHSPSRSLAAFNVVVSVEWAEKWGSGRD